jgi:hypothetical protein
LKILENARADIAEACEADFDEAGSVTVGHD